ncbi:glycosyltransferase family 4 protein [Spartinivicinus ruber]|uniref:glycosyltransferase family 4 protein n=1 Tax=Spartinivicinus ruber TaxID=2683272 RepID=UPI0013D382F9|nr:glycosyltransferase family 4 protein [Spartinivicinus ruber]
MKIVYVLTRSDVIGGASVHLLDLAGYAIQQGYQVTVIVGGIGVFNQKANEKGITCISSKYLVRSIHPVKDVLAFFELKRLILSLAPDIVHLHSTKAGVIGRLVSRRLGIPAIFTAHGWAFTEGVSLFRAKLYQQVERLLSRLSSKIIAVSGYDKNLAVENKVASTDHIEVVHNGVPNIAYKNIRHQQNSCKLIMVARFDQPKNHKDLITAISQISDLPWQLELVGSGPLLSEVKQYTKKLGIEHRVIFSGECHDVAKRISQADVFLLISNWEGLPLTIIEAMRGRLPVIASNVGGVPELVIDNETGYLVDRKDINKIVATLSDLIQSKDKRVKFGELGYQRYLRFFTADQMYQKTFKIYHEAIN